MCCYCRKHHPAGQWFHEGSGGAPHWGLHSIRQSQSGRVPGPVNFRQGFKLTNSWSLENIYYDFRLAIFRCWNFPSVKIEPQENSDNVNLTFSVGKDKLLVSQTHSGTNICDDIFLLLHQLFCAIKNHFKALKMPSTWGAFGAFRWFFIA